MILSVLALLLIQASPAGSPAPLPTPQSLSTAIVHAPKASLRLQVARTEDQRERGLMSVTALKAHTGMVFIFDTDGPVAFWMKDTLIPLDMIFIAPNGAVRKVFANVPVVPREMTDDAIPREQGDAKYVIELAAGEAAKDGIRQGTTLRNLPR